MSNGSYTRKLQKRRTLPNYALSSDIGHKQFQGHSRLAAALIQHHRIPNYVYRVMYILFAREENSPPDPSAPPVERQAISSDTGSGVKPDNK
ncbi:hypothetical protein Slin14017_G125190 [Septoria linicola]|nr:hypothetical protein Slin14017_G125190 [Septoria linicola]